MKNNPEAYLNHTLNKSMTKQTHMFCRSRRFQKHSRLQTQVKYHLPSMLGKRSCSFGYGQKSRLDDNRVSPSPNAYQLQNFSAIKKNISTSPSFAKSRDLISFGSYLFDVQKKAKKLPSPQHYDITLPKTHIGGRISERVKTQVQLKYKKELPGPGAYTLQKIAMANSPSFILSTYKKSISPKYHQSKEKIIKKSQSPLFYGTIQNQFGTAKLSKFKHVSAAIFSKSKRASLVDKQKAKYPSFKYKLFSQFGL